MANDLIYLNGINADTGTYLTPPMPEDAFARLALGETPDAAFQPELVTKGKVVKAKELGVIWSVNPVDLAEAGWGVIFAENADPNVQAAMTELLDYRRTQANAKQELYRCYTGAEGYKAGETKQAWLKRHKMGPGPADPSKVPYYLLLVGSPTEIPFGFQYQLDLQYAVGRIHFDTADEYARYAHAVVEAEQSKLPKKRRAAFFGVQNADDEATALTMTYLVKPLSDTLRVHPALSDWSFSCHLGAEATKARATALIGGEDTPALLFTGSHGVAFLNSNAGQREHQGALLCQDYPGPKQWQREIPQDFYFAGDDLTADAHVSGLITFHVACYGAGTPNKDDFVHLGVTAADQIPPQPFIARLPQRLLAHPNGGALASIGHVERAAPNSFYWDTAGAQTAAIEGVVGQILRGVPVGHALEPLNGRYAELSADLSATLHDINFNHLIPDNRELARQWTSTMDARSYILLGDPAVRLP